MKTSMIILLIAASTLLTSCEHTEMCVSHYTFEITGETYSRVNCQVKDGVLSCDSAYLVQERYESDETVTFEFTGTKKDFEDVEGTEIYEIDEGPYQVIVTKVTSCR